MKSSLLRFLLLSILTLGLASCHDTPQPNATVAKLGSKGFLVQGQFNSDGSFVPATVTQGRLFRNFVITAVRGVSIDDIKKVEVSLLNRKDSSLNIEYRFFWYDASGMDVSESSDTWHPMTLDANIERSLSSVGKSPLASQFTLYVRELSSRKR